MKSETFTIPLKYLLSFFIGFLLVFNLIQFLVFIILILNVKFTIINTSIMWILIYLTSFIGGMLGLFSYYKKDIRYRIWFPSKEKLLLNIIISISFAFGIQIYALKFDLPILFINIITTFILSYPFSALLFYIYNNYNKLKNKFIFVLLLIFISPVMIIIGNSNSIILNQGFLSNQKCGVFIKQLDERSPLTNFDVIGKYIYFVNNIVVNKIGDYEEILSSINSSDEIPLIIEKQLIIIKPYYDMSIQKYSLGLILEKKPC